MVPGASMPPVPEWAHGPNERRGTRADDPDAARRTAFRAGDGRTGAALIGLCAAQRFPASELPPLFCGAARLADGHLDAVGGAGLARVSADAFAVPAGAHLFLRAGHRVFHGLARWDDRRPRGQAENAAHNP